MVNPKPITSRTSWLAEIRMDEISFTDWIKSRDVADKIHNCQVVHYTRHLDPEDARSALANSPQYRRSVCPWDQSLSRDEWQKIERPVYTNEEMLEGLDYYPTFVKPQPS